MKLSALIAQLARRFVPVLLILCLGVMGYAVRFQLAHMDEVFFQPSLHGAKGLVWYLVGQYGPAARAYKSHFQESDIRGMTISDNGADALLTGDSQEVQRRARKVLEDNEGNIPALLDLSQIALYEGDYPRSKEFLRRILELDPDEPDALVLASLLFARIGDYDHSIELLNHVLRISQVASRTSVFLTLLEAAGDFSAYPEDNRPNCLLSLYYRYLRIYDNSNGRLATVAAKAAIRAGDRPADAFLTIGVVYEKSGDLQRALDAFQKSIEANPRVALGYWWAAGTYGKLGDVLNEYRMAKAAFESAPGDPFYITRLDHVLVEKLGDASEAISIFERAVEVSPSNVEAFSRLGYAHGFVGNAGRSVAAYEKALALDPQRLEVYLAMARSLAYLGKTREAAHVLRKASDIAPLDPSPHTALARLYVSDMRLREAVAEFEEAFRLGLDDNDERSELCALYHFELAEYQQAATCFRDILARNPKDQRAQRMLPEALQNLTLERAQR